MKDISFIISFGSSDDALLECSNKIQARFPGIPRESIMPLKSNQAGIVLGMIEGIMEQQKLFPSSYTLYHKDDLTIWDFTNCDDPIKIKETVKYSYKYLIDPDDLGFFIF